MAKQYKLAKLENEEELRGNYITHTCKQCGCINHVRIPAESSTRNPIGAGTKAGAGMKLNNNRKRILAVLNQHGPCSNYKILRVLRENKVPRDGQVTWNEHNVQADESNLRGGGHTEMEGKHKIEEEFHEEYGWQTKNRVIPYYKAITKVNPEEWL